MHEINSFTLHYPVFAENLRDVPQTLLSFIELRFAKLATNELYQWIENGRVQIDSEAAHPAQLLKAGQQVSISLPGHIEEAVDTSWRTVWENEEIMAVYKPHNLPVSRTTRNLHNTLIQLIRRQTPYLNAHLLHRLDTETAGLILLAKNKAADKKWKPRLTQLIQRKVYQARVYGDPEWEQQLMECELSEREHSAIRCQMHVVEADQPEQYRKPQQSKTAFRVLQRYGDQTLIECELFTGRKHQIRAHLAHLGHPIIGDKIYAHDGHYYLKRLNGPLGEADIRDLGGDHQQLVAVELVLQPEPDAAPIQISLNR